MKQVFILFSLLIACTMNAQEVHEQKIESTIKQVTVFITGGEVHRQTSAKVKKGRNKLIFTRISTVVDNKSVQFSAEGDYSLVSVSSEIDYFSALNANPRIQDIQDSIQILNNEITALSNERSAYQGEKDLLKKNNQIKGSQKNLSVQELSEMGEFYRTRMIAINKEISALDLKIQDLNSTQNKYRQQLSELNYNETIKSNQIVVIIDSPSDQTLSLDLKYIVSNCGWQANYDLAAADVNSTIHLKYKAKVFNNTGNDWKDVSMTLSTADPNLSASAPVLNPWYLNYSSLGGNDYSKNDYMVPTNRVYKQYYDNASLPDMSQNLDGLTLDNTISQWPEQQNKTVSFTTIQVSQLSTEFVIEKKYSIPADSKPYLVEITEHELTATFSHKAVPKLDKDAFLLANIVGWEKLDLVPGPAHVYFADTYVGQSYINTQNVGDTLRLSFGRDKRVVVDRKLLEEFSDKKVIGSNRKDSYTYEITVKNNRTSSIKLNLFDQVPISQDSDISVSVDEISSAEYDATTGRLLWKVNLGAGETVKYKISFTIKYPKEKKITVQKYRTVSAPKF